MQLPSALFSRPQALDVFSVFYNNFAYRTLGLHRHSHRERINEFGRMKPLPAGWDVCVIDADALKVASSFVWQCEFLVFANGAAAWTSGACQ